MSERIRIPNYIKFSTDGCKSWTDVLYDKSKTEEINPFENCTKEILTIERIVLDSNQSM